VVDSLALSPNEVQYFQVVGKFDGVEYALSRELPTLKMAEGTLIMAWALGLDEAYLIRGGWAFEEGDPAADEFREFIDSGADPFARAKIRYQWPGLRRLQ
jgi:hypothetical protein